MKEGRDSHLANYNHGAADASGVSVELLFAGKQAELLGFCSGERF